MTLSQDVLFYRGTLEGKRHRPEYDELLLDPLLKYSGLYESGGIRGDLAASLQVWAGGRPLALPVHTAYKHFTTRWKYVVLCIYAISLLSRSHLLSR